MNMSLALLSLASVFLYVLVLNESVINFESLRKKEDLLLFFSTPVLTAPASKLIKINVSTKPVK